MQQSKRSPAQVQWDGSGHTSPPWRKHAGSHVGEGPRLAVGKVPGGPGMDGTPSGVQTLGPLSSASSIMVSAPAVHLGVCLKDGAARAPSAESC